MTSYAYNNQVTPPAPFVHVSVGCPETGLHVADIPAQIDTACDRTVVPLKIIEALGLASLRILTVSVAGGQELRFATFFVRIALRTFSPLNAEVFGHAEEPVVLLGRDILNRHRIVLDGPNLSLEIS